jgi:hypothetical protein
MSKLRGHGAFVRQCISAASTLALVLHLLLSGLALARAVPAVDAPDAFTICHGAGGISAGGEEAPANPLPAQSPCILCTLSHSCAVLPNVSVFVVLGAFSFLDTLALFDFGSPGLDAPRAAQPRGPPHHASIAG